MQHWERTPLSALSIFPSALSVKERQMSREAKRLKLPTYEKWNWTDHSHPVPAINRGPTVNVGDHSRKQTLQPIGALDHGRCHSICQTSIRPEPRRLPNPPPVPSSATLCHSQSRDWGPVSVNDKRATLSVCFSYSLRAWWWQMRRTAAQNCLTLRSDWLMWF